MSYATAILTGTYQHFNGDPAEGVVEIIPNSKSLIDSEGNVILTGRVKVTLDEAGSFSVVLPATDDATVEPALDRQYTVVAKLRHQHLPAVTGIVLPTDETRDMADLTTAEEATASLSVWLTEEGYEADLAGKETAGAAATAEANANTYTDTAVAGEVTRADAAYATKATQTTVETGRLSEAELSATFARPVGHRMVIVGDSITNQCGEGPSGFAVDGDEVNAVGYFGWANLYLGQRFQWVHTAGYAGSRADEIAALMPSVLDAHECDWVTICAGANSIAQGHTSAQLTSDLDAMLTEALGRGLRVVLSTVPPSTAYDTDAEKAALHETNAWVRQQGLERPGVVVVDMWKATVDPATGHPASHMTSDGVHPSWAGAERMGRALADALTPVTTPVPPPWATFTDPANVIGNPNFTSLTGWSSNNANLTLSTAVTDDTAAGLDLICTIAGETAVASRHALYTELSTSGRYAAGDVVQASVEVEWEDVVAAGAAGVLSYPVLRIIRQRADFVGLPPDLWGLYTGSTISAQPGGLPAAGSGVLLTPKGTISADTGRFLVCLGWHGAASGTIRFRNLAVRKVA